MYGLDVNIDNTVKVRYRYIIKLLFIQIFTYLIWMTLMSVVDNLFLLSIQHNSNCFQFNYETTSEPSKSFILKKRNRGTSFAKHNTFSNFH
jgi:hypothetical protein